MGSLDDYLNRLAAQSAAASVAAAQARYAYNGRQRTLNEMLDAYNYLVNGTNIIQPAILTDPATRIAEIDKELDVIRGIIPTPKGYKIDPNKAKMLMSERRELKQRLTS